MLTGKRIVLGVSGGIAVYKAVDLVSRLKKQHADVRVVMTKNACEFVAPLSFETLSANQVYTSSFEKAWEIEHISLQKYADLLILAPATANIIGKYAHGIADDLLSTTLMANTAPVLIAPAMNAQMYRSPANQANLQILRDRGVHFIGPDSGFLACGDEDIGRMSAPEAIVDAAIALLNPKRDLEGVRVLVTAGPTREMIDPVRYLSNRSTGKMGYAIAEAARDRGAEVTLISGPCDLEKPVGMNVIDITSSQDLYDAVTGNISDMDIAIQAAAPADYTPASVSQVKLKKSDDDMSIPLKRTKDIAKAIGDKKKPNQVFVIFAAETNDVLSNAKGKLQKKHADLVVANDVTAAGAGFAGDTNIVTLISADDQISLPLMQKRDVADAILDRAIAIFEAK